MQIKKTNNGYQIVARILCEDKQYHTLRVSGYSTSKEAKADYQNQLELFKERMAQKYGKDLVDKMDNNTFKSVCDEYILNYASVNKLNSVNKLKGRINLRFLSFFPPNTKVDYVFTEENMYKWKCFIGQWGLCQESYNRDLNIMKDIIDRAIRRGVVVDIQQANRSTLQLQNVRVQKNKINNKKQIWTIDEFNKFIDTFDDNNIEKYMFECFFLTGIRIGEMCGLQWRNVDFENNTITIDHQANNKLGTGKSELTTPKTSSSYRVIELNKSFMNKLYWIKSNVKPREEDFVFFGKKAGSPTTIRRHLDEHIEIAKVKKITPHGFRHTHSTMLLHLKLNTLYIKERMGHADIREDYSTYGHATEDDKALAVKALELLSQ